jgi:hypothetical protein
VRRLRARRPYTVDIHTLATHSMKPDPTGSFYDHCVIVPIGDPLTKEQEARPDAWATESGHERTTKKGWRVDDISRLLEWWASRYAHAEVRMRYAYPVEPVRMLSVIGEHQLSEVRPLAAAA